MIDTIKLCHTIYETRWPKISKHFPNLTISSNGITRSILNPTNSDKKKGVYKPKITLVKRPNSGLLEIILEFSAPKLIFGNNFEEISTEDFPILYKEIQKIFLGFGILLTIEDIMRLEVRKVDFCKNIPLSKYIFPTSVINYISKGDFPLNKDVQKTDFRNGGQILHIHTNSVDIALYDKILDLKQSNISEKRSFEKDYYCQKDLLKNIDNLPQILRFEIRINSVKYLKKEFQTTNKVKLSDLTTTKQAVQTLLNYWGWLLDKVPKLQIYSHSSFNDLLNSSRKGFTPLSTLAYVGVQAILAENYDLRAFRVFFEKQYGKHSWNRIKPFLEPINNNYLKEFVLIENIIRENKVIKLKDFIFVK